MNDPEISAHRFAESYPLLSGEALESLAESVKLNGLLRAITLYEGQILDGRNRYAACHMVGVEPRFETFEGTDEEAVDLVAALNSDRRHQSEGSRAMSDARNYLDIGRRVNGRWKRGTVAIYESVHSEGYRVRLAEAGTILDHRPDLAQRVVDEELPISAAYKLAIEERDRKARKAKEEEAREAQEAAARTFLETNAPDMAGLVVDGTLKSYLEAEAVWEQRNREEAEKRRKEKEAEEKAERQRLDSLRDLYTGIARALQVLAGYGGYADISKLWSEYNPAHLDPPQLARQLAPEQLAQARRLIDWLTEWTEETP